MHCHKKLKCYEIIYSIITNAEKTGISNKGYLLPSMEHTTSLLSRMGISYIAYCKSILNTYLWMEDHTYLSKLCPKYFLVSLSPRQSRNHSFCCSACHKSHLKQISLYHREVELSSQLQLFKSCMAGDTA